MRDSIEKIEKVRKLKKKIYLYKDKMRIIEESNKKYETKGVSIDLESLKKVNR